MTKMFDDLPWIVRLILLIVLGWLIGGIYRIVKWTESKNTANINTTLITKSIPSKKFGLQFVS